MQNDDTRTATRILRKPAVLERTGLSYTTIWRRERAGDFPPRVQLSPGAVGWRESDVEAWIAGREMATR